MLVAPITLALASLTAAEKLPARQAVAVNAAPARVAQVQALLLKQKRGLRPIPIDVPPSTTTTTRSDDDEGPTNVGGPGDENVLKNVKLAVTDDALVSFFKKRTPPAPDKEKIAGLIKDLAAADSKDADAAQGELIAIGQPALPLLRTASNNTDEVEASKRARACMEQIEGANASNLVINAARLLAARKPAGACEALLGYLPFAEDETAYAEVEHALISVAVKNGKPDPALIKALKDPIALRRASVAHVLAAAGGSAHYASIRPLLKDEKPSVRLKAALGLVSAYDSEAIPVLIGLMGEPPSRMRNKAENYLTNLAGEWAVSGPKSNDATSRRLRRQVWEAWWKGVDPEKIMEDLKDRTPSDDEHDKIVKAISALDDSVAEVRDKASTDLVNMGKKASALLRRAVEQQHARISPSAAKCLELIEKDKPDPLPMAAPRILGLRRPAGAVKSLLGYLPFADSDEHAQQVTDILGAIGVSGTKGDEDLVKGLEDPLPARRAAAITALCKGKATDNMAAMRKMLRDKDQTVQLRAAQGLAPMGDKKAISTMIALLRDLPLDQCWEVEDFLGRVAGEKAPTTTVSADKESRNKALEAWAKWWTENSKNVDLTKLDLSVEREKGYYLVTENYNPQTGRGRVHEVDGNGKVRWTIDNLSGPYDACLVRGGNVLVVENMNRVTERDRTGKIVGLDKYFPSVFQVERLRDGNTFVACRNSLQIVDAKGNAKFTHTYNNHSILGARIFRDGSMAFVSYGGEYVRIDRNGKEQKKFTVPLWNFSLYGAAIQDNDRFVVCINGNQVKEYGSDGKEVWSVNVATSYPPSRLSNGNVLVTNNQMQILEIDGKGKTVKTITLKDIRPYRISKR